jgi:hypothetical protein
LRLANAGGFTRFNDALDEATVLATPVAVGMRDVALPLAELLARAEALVTAVADAAALAILASGGAEGGSTAVVDAAGATGAGVTGEMGSGFGVSCALHAATTTQDTNRKDVFTHTIMRGKRSKCKRTHCCGGL